ncbi:14803_t:CDS:2, partial [Cetraspora pellucida]
MYELDKLSEEEYKKSENENYQTTEDFYFMNNPWSDVEFLNETEILLITNPITSKDMDQKPKMHK